MKTLHDFVDGDDMKGLMEQNESLSVRDCIYYNGIDSSSQLHNMNIYGKHQIDLLKEILQRVIKYGSNRSKIIYSRCMYITYPFERDYNQYFSKQIEFQRCLPCARISSEKIIQIIPFIH